MGNELLDVCLALALHILKTNAVHFARLRYHYISYEHLLSPSLRSPYMREVLFFLGAQSSIDDVDPFAHEDDALKKFGSSSCHERGEEGKQPTCEEASVKSAAACYER